MQEAGDPSPDPNSSLYEEILSDNKRVFKCLFPDCGKIIRFKSDMKRHMIIHSRARPFVCNFPHCRRSFKRQDALRHHIESHNEDFKFPCTVPGCGARFQKKTALKYHLEKHKDEKFFCNFPGCNKSFSTLKHLKQHENAKAYHDKLLSDMQKSSKKNTDDFDCFLSPFENWSPEQRNNAPQIRVFDDDFSPDPERFLHPNIEEVKADDHRFDSFSEHADVTPAIEFSDPRELSNTQYNEPTMLMVCKYLLEENKNMKEKLASQVGSLKAEYGNHLNSMLKEALSFQFDKKNDQE